MAEYEIQVQLRDCDGHQIRLIKLPENTRSRQKWWIFCRQLEYLIFETTANLSNLLHGLEALELTSSVRHYKRAGDFGTTQAQHKELLNQFNKFKRSVEPMSGPGKQCSLIPLKVGCTVALNRGKKDLLLALGGEKAVPEEWLRQERLAQNAAKGEIEGTDLLPDEEETDRELGNDELLLAVLSSELFNDFDVEGSSKAAEEEEAALGRNYALPADQINAALKQQLEDMTAWRTRILCASRTGKRVQEVTVATDKSTLLRFLGWLKAQPRSAGALDCTVFAQENAQQLVEAFVTWGVDERGVSYGTIGTYTNSLLSCANFAAASGIQVEDTVLQALYNLRSQAEAQGREDRMYKKRHSEWISWAEAQDTRLEAIRRLEATTSRTQRHERLQLAEDALIISLYTVAPPDRVGVIRKLSWGNTLKRGGGTGFFIDLTAPRLHKTSKFYGPSMTSISKLVVPVLNSMLELQQGDEWDFTEEEAGPANRTQLEYLFYKDHSTRCYSESEWSKRASQAFERHSPRHTRTPARLLRSAFITELRSAPDCPREVLEAAATCMKHAIDTQGSDVYDLDTHTRLTAKAFDWCETYAQQHVQGGEEQQEQADVDVVHGEEEEESKARRKQPMKSVVRDVRQKVAADQDTSGASTSAAGNEHAIDRITGGSMEPGEPPLYRVEWEGHAHVTSWWQTLGSADVNDDEMYRGYMVDILPRGTAPDLTGGNSKRTNNSTVMVLGACTDEEGVRICYEPDGTEHRLHMAGCQLDGESRDWLLSLDRNMRYASDHIIGWEHQDVAQARTAWGNGEFYPTLQDARAVLRHLGEIATSDMDALSAKHRQAAIGIALFMSQPAKEAFPLAVDLAADLRHKFVDGGLINDSLAIAASMDEKSIKMLQ